MPSYKKISTEIIHQNSWWTYYHDKYILPNGQEGDYYYGETIGSGCAMIVPVLDDGRLLLTKQHRYLRGKQSIEFPCGGIKAGEAPSETAIRELLEETGYRAGDMMKVGACDGLNGIFKDTCHVFIATELKLVQPPQPDNSENFETIFRRLDEFEDVVNRGEIWDGQTLAAWALSRDKIYKMLNI